MAKIGENVKINLLKIAVTGEISSGKSTVCKYFKQLGAFVVDTDKIVHKLLSSKTSIGQKTTKFLGKDILENGEISRDKIADIVFDDTEKIKTLEAIIHPSVFEEIENLYAEAKEKQKHLFFVVEIPLLFETQKEKFYDYIIVVTSDSIIEKKTDKKRKQRFIDIDEKTEKADFVIRNNESFTMLKRKVTKIKNVLTKLLRSTPLNESR